MRSYLANQRLIKLDDVWKWLNDYLYSGAWESIRKLHDKRQKTIDSDCEYIDY